MAVDNVNYDTRKLAPPDFTDNCMRQETYQRLIVVMSILLIHPAVSLLIMHNQSLLWERALSWPLLR